MEPEQQIEERDSQEEESPAVPNNGGGGADDLEKATSPNPDGFFPNLTDSVSRLFLHKISCIVLEMAFDNKNMNC